MRRLRLEIRTPQERAFIDEVDEAVVPLSDGWCGVLPGHAPFMARLMRGNMVARQGDQTITVATLGGVLTTDGTVVTILTGGATVGRDITALEREISEEVRAIEEVEAEAEKHFSRVYRQMADALRRRRR